MGKMQRTKGAAGEREFINLLKDYLGDQTIKRNLAQYQQSGESDVLGVEGFAIEVKRHKKANIQAWWREAEEQAINAGKIPALAYRVDFQKRWRVVVPLYCIGGISGHGFQWTTDMDVEAFCAVARERMAA